MFEGSATHMGNVVFKRMVTFEQPASDTIVGTLLAAGVDSSINEGVTIPTTSFDGYGWETSVMFTYKPKSTSSRLLIRFDNAYNITGGGEDIVSSRILVDGTSITSRSQTFQLGGGTGTRSNVLFPILGIVKNEALEPRTIAIQINRGESDDIVNVSDTEWTLEVFETQV
jgi:hypothetical protein